MIKFNYIREKIVAKAIEQKEKPYVHDTYGPNTFDCAGLVWYVYNSVLNINIFEEGFGKSTTTKIMTSKYGKLVLFDEQSLEKNLSLIKEGDILLFHTQSLQETGPKDYNRYPGHCGIYLGSNVFIHASNKKGMITKYTLNQNKALYKKLVGFKKIVD